MSTQAVIATHAHFVSVELNIEAADVQTVGEKMQAINQEADMNGYNWDAFFDRYLAIVHPEMREGLERDPEINIYLALYENTAEGNRKAERLALILNRLIANPERIYAYMREDGDGVEWV